MSLKLTSWLEAYSLRDKPPIRELSNFKSQRENCHFAQADSEHSAMASHDHPASEKQATTTSGSVASSNPPPLSSPNVPSLKSQPRSWSWHIFSLLLSLLWLGPIITLLVLNFRNHVIGASIWCPFGKCFSDAFGDDAIATAVRLDKWDHDLLASLQFAAQAFEIWFLVIATALLYDVGMIFARRYVQSWLARSSFGRSLYLRESVGWF